MAIYVVVEGDGDRRAVPNLLTRLTPELGHHVVWKPPLRINVLREADAEKAASLVRGREDTEGLLVLRDDEDGCPLTDGPEMAAWFKALALPFPVACVLFYREYETIFLPFLRDMAGVQLDHKGIQRPGLNQDAKFEGDPEGKRDAKGVISRNMPPGRQYKETTDQLALTRLLDIASVRRDGPPCFGTLERAVDFLASGRGKAGQAFPIDR